MLNQDVAVLLGEVDAVTALSKHTLAYIGPGAGLGAILLVIALGLGALLLLVGLVWYPLKRFFGTSTNDAASGAGTDEAE